MRRRTTYDDPDIESSLSEAEQEDLALLRGPRDTAEAVYAEVARALHDDPIGAFEPVVAGWSAPERRWFAESAVREVFALEVRHGLAAGHRGYLEDGLRTIRALEVDPAHVRCPVRALHGTADTLEPYANLRRLAALLPDVAVVTFEDAAHFGPWALGEVVAAVIAAQT